MAKNFALILVALASLRGQMIPPTKNPDLVWRNKQISCEEKLLRSMKTKEIQKGSEYRALLDVAVAFDLDNPPRLYLSSRRGNASYLAGSVRNDGRGKIVVSREFAKRTRNTLALKGILAHEMAHLVSDVHGDESCVDWLMRDPKTEMAADALAAKKVGAGTVKAFLVKLEELTEAMSGDMAMRIRALEKLEAQESRRR
ncbi:MAG: M48 family metalloprotease [Minisyncoccia bacterium]|jgi:Zn-dependent protease with chaperone function